jgi:hypothetical protein
MSSVIYLLTMHTYMINIESSVEKPTNEKYGEKRRGKCHSSTLEHKYTPVS